MTVANKSHEQMCNMNLSEITISPVGDSFRVRRDIFCGRKLTDRTSYHDTAEDFRILRRSVSGYLESIKQEVPTYALFQKISAFTIPDRWEWNTYGPIEKFHRKGLSMFPDRTLRDHHIRTCLIARAPNSEVSLSR